MKKHIYISIIILLIVNISCEDYLTEEAKTDVSLYYIYNTPEGLKNGVVGLYDANRNFYNFREAGGESCHTLFTYVLHDLVVAPDSYLRIIAHWKPGQLTPDSWGATLLRESWKNFYNVIDKANAIIDGAETVEGMNEEERQQVIGQAKVFRANSLFILWRMFNNVYIKTEPTTPENVFIRVEGPDTKEDILAQIAEDLDDGIEYLPWTFDEPGRVTKAFAYHLRAKVALWQEDWQKAAECADAIIDNPNYELVDADKVFVGDRNHEESIFVIQIERGASGGGNYNFLRATFLAEYSNSVGAVPSLDQGGRGLGWVYPNNYLLNMYDPSDLRYEHWYRKYFFYNDPDHLPDSVLVSNEGGIPVYKYPEIGDTIVELDTSSYYDRIHPSIRKFEDDENDDPDQTGSWSNILIYRLAEIYIIAAEAYMRMEDQVAACERINYLRSRAGLEDISYIDEDVLMNEHAMELAFEGQRYYFLKRIGRLVSQVQAHVGDPGVEDLGRENIQNYMVNLPIPTAELQLLGANYPQNPGY